MVLILPVVPVELVFDAKRWRYKRMSADLRCRNLDVCGET